MVSGGTSKIYGEAEVTKISKTDHLIVARVMVADSVIAGNLYYFLPAKELKLPEVKITQEIESFEDGYIIRLTSDRLAKNVFLSLNGDGFFSDNYFDLLPGEIRTITCRTSLEPAKFNQNLKITCLQNIYK